MSADGHLEHFPVADLLRLLGRRQRPALVTLIRSGRTAILKLDGGQLLFARQGRLEGEAAVAEVLGWSDGIFRVGVVNEVLPRNVFASLETLLSPAVAGSASSAAGPVARVTPSFDERRFDADLDDLVVRLAGDLLLLEDPRRRRQGALALAVLEEILARLLAFLARWDAAWSEEELRDLVARQTARTPGLVGAAVAAGAISLTHARGADPGQRVYFRSAAAGAVDLATSLLYRLTPRFSAPERRRLWQETLEAFLTDLTRALEACES